MLARVVAKLGAWTRGPGPLFGPGRWSLWLQPGGRGGAPRMGLGCAMRGKSPWLEGEEGRTGGRGGGRKFGGGFQG